MQSLVYDFILLMDIAHCEYFNEDYRKFLFVELSRALDKIDFDTWEGVDEAAAYVEKVIYSNTDFKGSGDVALVGHSHLDIAYYWRRIHAVQKNARTCLILVLRLSLIPIIVATVIGLIVSLLQALTQIQEQTLGFAVKLIAISLTILACASWMGGQLLLYTQNIFTRFALLGH